MKELTAERGTYRCVNGPRQVLLPSVPSLNFASNGWRPHGDSSLIAMGARKYRHFSIEERCEIARRRQAGESIRQIAAALDRSPSSIARELEQRINGLQAQLCR
jgi:hypothetical protein